MTPPIVGVLLFRRDLRLGDHAALTAASQECDKLIPLYVLDETAARPAGAAAKWWLHENLRQLETALRQRGSGLAYAENDTCGMLSHLAQSADVTRIYLQHDAEPQALALETRIHDWAMSAGIDVRRFAGQTLLSPTNIATQQGKPYQVFTPFWRTAQSQISAERLLSIPSTLPPLPDLLPTTTLVDLPLLPYGEGQWTNGLARSFIPGEAAALKVLDRFIHEDLRGYAAHRDRPDMPRGTSRLSPYLAIGCISPRTVWRRISDAIDHDPSLSPDGAVFLKEIGWREFSHHLLHHFPFLPTTPLRQNFSSFPWRSTARMPDAARDLRAWQQGLTGFPIVDAGMRELWKTGWMHNRVRMIVASFLVKELLIHWQEGEAWFWDTLVDADPASNVANWQWVAGCGADAAPYFRIFNPVLQGRKFDPEGDYVRAFVPELRQLPAKYIHTPHEAPPHILQEAGIKLGTDYPPPLVDRTRARTRALNAFKSLNDG